MDSKDFIYIYIYEDYNKSVKKPSRGLSCNGQRKKLMYIHYSASDLMFKILLKDTFSLIDNICLFSPSLGLSFHLYIEWVSIKK